MTARRWIGIVLLAAVLGAVGALAYLLLRPGGEPVPPEPDNVVATVNQAAAAPATGIRARPEAEQRAAAFAAAFGGNGSRSVGDNQYRYRPAGLIWIGERAVLISAGTNGQDCHACAGTLAVHYLAADGDGFRVTGTWLEGGGFADYGRPPDWRFSSELSGQPMLRTEGGGGNQGIFCGQVSFHEFAEGGPREVAEIPVGYSNASGMGGADDGAQIEGRMRNIRPNESFEVAYSGTRSFVERWLFRNGRWAPERPTQVPTC